MSVETLAGREVSLNQEGYLEDPKQWTREIAQVLAEREGIELTERHWEVIRYIRSELEAGNAAPNVRRLAKKGGFPTKEMYALFPGGPAKKASKIAGGLKPAGCVKTRRRP